MGIRKSFARFTAAIIFAVFVCAVPSFTLAAGPEKKASAPQPRPDTVTKAYTNDDLGWHSATPAPASEIQSGESQGAISVPPPANPSYEPALPKVPLNPEQNPQWYAKQLSQRQAQLAAVESREAQLAAFRASGSTDSTGPTIGLVLNAPCEGITTDNLIAQLDARRQEINEQIDSLEDTARTNGLPSGIIEQASEAGQPQPTADQEREALTSRYQQLSGEVAETQAVTEEMQEQAASQGITLIPPTPGNGGNMTTDLIERLDARADNIQNELSNVEDDARSLGAQPGDLR
jgi:hypothetical protein